MTHQKYFCEGHKNVPELQQNNKKDVKIFISTTSFRFQQVPEHLLLVLLLNIESLR